MFSQEKKVLERSERFLNLMPKQVEAKVSKLEGSPSAERGKFAQAYEYTPSEEDLLEKRGRLFVVLDIAADPGFDTALAGKLVWDSLNEEYFSETEETPLKTLERAVLSAKNRLTNLTHPVEGEEAVSPELSAKEEVELNLAAAVVWGDPAVDRAGVLYLARHNNPTLLLKRGGQVREPLAGEEPSGVASLMVEDGDVVILGSRAFGKNFPSNTLPEISFLEKEFKSGRQVPGLAAIILKLKVTIKRSEIAETAKQARTKVTEEREEVEEVPFESKPGLKLPSVAGVLERLPGKKGDLPLPADKAKSRVQRLGSVSGRFLGGLARRVTEGIGTRITRGQEIYSGKRRPEIGLPKVITALVLIFLFSVTFTLWQQRQRTRAEEFTRLLSSAEAIMNEADDLAGLSDERAKELWQEAQEELEKAAALNPKDERLNSLSQRAETLFNRIEKITPITEEHLFYDLTLQPFGLAQGEQIQALSLTGKGEIVYVAEEKTGATLAIKQTTPPQVEEATANEIKGAKRVRVEGEFLYLLTGENFYRYNLKTGKKDNPVSFDRYNKVAAFDLYGIYLERNIYFLVPSENQIYKFLDLEGSYSQVRSWLKESLVLEEAVDMTIDGSVWILLKGGTVPNLLAGKRESFSFKNLPTPIADPIAIYTRPNFKKLYIGDGSATGGRVAVFEKEGQFVKQFKGEVLSGLVDLWVTDDEKTLFLLTQSKIYKISL